MLTEAPLSKSDMRTVDDPIVADALRALDNDNVRTSVGDLIKGADGEAPAACRFVEALYHPGRYVRAAFALVSDPETPRKRYWPQGQVIYLHHPVRRPMSRRGRVIMINDSAFECYAFPNDRRLRGLRRFTSRHAATACWQDWLDRSGDAFNIDPSTLRRVMLRYVPEQKWIARLRCRGFERSSQQPAKRSVAVRSAGRDAVMNLTHRHAVLARSAKRGAISFDVPDVVGVEPTVGLVAVEWIKHLSLPETMQQLGVSTTCSRVSKCVRSLHNARIGGLDVLDPDHLVRRMVQACNDLQSVYPSWAASLAKVVRFCESVVGRAAWNPTAMLHNDLHLGQVGLRHDRMVLFDLERLAIGDPIVDVANLYVQIRLAGLRDEFAIDPPTANEWAKAQVDAFRTAGVSIDSLLFQICASLSALELARGMMRHLRANWFDTAEQCIHLSERLISGEDLK